MEKVLKLEDLYKLKKEIQDDFDAEPIYEDGAWEHYMGKIDLLDSLILELGGKL